jgi:hypothetical protein
MSTMRDDYTANPVALNARLVQEFRAGGGRVGGPERAGRPIPMVLIERTGAAAQAG